MRSIALGLGDSMTEQAYLDALLDRIEGGVWIDPNPNAGATNFGITAASWGAYRNMGRRATAKEVKAITREQAVEFYRTRYLVSSPFNAIRFEPLRIELIDFAINSGTARACRWLQRLLRVPVTSVYDERTDRALQTASLPLLTDALAGVRARMIVGAVEHDRTIPSNEELGLLRRALSFVTTTVDEEDSEPGMAAAV